MADDKENIIDRIDNIDVDKAIGYILDEGRKKNYRDQFDTGKDWTLLDLAGMVVAKKDKDKKFTLDTFLEHADKGGSLYAAYKAEYRERLKDQGLKGADLDAALDKAKANALQTVEILKEFAAYKVDYKAEGEDKSSKTRIGNLEYSLALSAIGEAYINPDGRGNEGREETPRNYYDVFVLEGDKFSEREMHVYTGKYAKDEDEKPFLRNLPTLEEFYENIEQYGDGFHLSEIYPDMTIEQAWDYFRNLRSVVDDNGNTLANKPFIDNYLERFSDAVYEIRQSGPQYEQAFMALTLKGGGEDVLDSPSAASVEAAIDTWRDTYKIVEQYNFGVNASTNDENINKKEGLGIYALADGLALEREKTKTGSHKEYEKEVDRYEKNVQEAKGKDAEIAPATEGEKKVVAFAKYAEDRGYVEHIPDLDKKRPINVKAELFEVAFGKEYKGHDNRPGFAKNLKEFFGDHLDAEDIYLRMPRGLEYKVSELSQVLNNDKMERAFRDNLIPLGKDEDNFHFELLKNLIKKAKKQEITFRVEGKEVAFEDLTLRELTHSRNGEPTLLEQAAAKIFVGKEIDIPKYPNAYKRGYEEGDSYYYVGLEEKYPREFFRQNQVSKKEIEEAIADYVATADLKELNESPHPIEVMYPEELVLALFDPRENTSTGDPNNRAEFESEARFVTLETVMEWSANGRIEMAAKKVGKDLDKEDRNILENQYHNASDDMNNFVKFVKTNIDSDLSEDFKEIPFYVAQQVMIKHKHAYDDNTKKPVDKKVLEQDIRDAIEEWKLERKVTEPEEEIGQDFTPLWSGKIPRVSAIASHISVKHDGNKDHTVYELVDSYKDLDVFFDKLRNLSGNKLDEFIEDIDKASNINLDNDNKEQENIVKEGTDLDATLEDMAEDMMPLVKALQKKGINYTFTRSKTEIAEVPDKFEKLNTNTDGDNKNYLDAKEIEANPDLAKEILEAVLDHDMEVTMKVLQDKERGSAHYMSEDDINLAEYNPFEHAEVNVLLNNAAEEVAEIEKNHTYKGQNAFEHDVLFADTNGDGNITTKEISNNMKKYFDDEEIDMPKAKAIDAINDAYRKKQQEESQGREK